MSPVMGRLSIFRRFQPAFTKLDPGAGSNTSTPAAAASNNVAIPWTSTTTLTSSSLSSCSSAAGIIRSGILPSTLSSSATPRRSSSRSSTRARCSSRFPASAGSITILITSLVSALARGLASLLAQFRSPEVATPLQGGRLGLALLSTSAIAQAHLSPVLVTLKANPTFMSGLVAWMVAQASKVVTTYIVCRRWDLRMLVGSGGMPSSHSALCVGLTTSVALSHGVGDALFPVCLGFTLIVMYDATGVRRHAGMQAEVLNMIIKDLFQGHPVSEKKLKELLGHTPLQVLAGALVGVVAGYYCCTAAAA